MMRPFFALTTMILVIAAAGGVRTAAAQTESAPAPGRLEAETAKGGAGGKPCKPLTCADLGYDCGVWDDGCGGTVDCGDCPDGGTCDEGRCEGDSDWETPDCDRITGTRAVTYTADGGETVATTVGLQETTYTYGLAALDRPNTLLAAAYTGEGNTIYLSEDAGCSWNEIAFLEVSSSLRLTPVPGGGAYGWTYGRNTVIRYTGEEFLAWTAPVTFYGLAVDPEDPDHLRIGGSGGQLYESFDGGETFDPLGIPIEYDGYGWNTADFDPHNWDHVLYGGTGAWYTTDAGQSWHGIEPFLDGNSNPVFRFVFSPDDPQRVWARCNLDVYDRAVLVSDDGGVSFEVAFLEGAYVEDQFGEETYVSLTNQPPMAAKPGDPDVLYFVFNKYDLVGYQAYLVSYDLGEDEYGLAKVEDVEGIDALVFSPADPEVLYLGLQHVVLSLNKDLAQDGAPRAAVLSEVTAAPNPFNPSTTIQLKLEAASRVKLDVYDLKGSLVRTLADGDLPAGVDELIWNGRDRAGGVVASGAYYFVAQAGGETVRGKLVMLK